MVQTIDVSARSTAGPDTIYALLADGSTWPSWSPLRTYALERPAPDGGAGLGAVRRFTTGRTVSIEEVVIAEPGRRFGYALLSGLPLRDYRATVTLTADGDGTAIRWQSVFRPKLPGTGRLYRWALGKFIQRCVDGLAAHAAVTGVKA